MTVVVISGRIGGDGGVALCCRVVVMTQCDGDEVCNAVNVLVVMLVERL